MTQPPYRTAFLIDGFNLYHSVRAARAALAGASTKWLDIRRLCESYLHVVGGGAQLCGVYYFSALAKHLEATKPDVTKRHDLYLECLRETGVSVELARFKKKSVFCDTCKQHLKRYEEKETDVAIAVKLLELFHLGQCDTAVLITGDTDIAPAVRTVQRLFPTARVCFAFPYSRKNKELAQLVKTSFQISKEAYASNQFPDPFVCSDGRTIAKPTAW